MPSWWSLDGRIHFQMPISGFSEPLISQKLLFPGNTHFQNPLCFPNPDFNK